MANRAELQSKLETLLNSRNVYYQPPETIKMEYPAIVYSKSDVDSKFADDKPYMHKNKYEIIVINKEPDNPVIDAILNLPMCTYDRYYTAEKLCHDVMTLYY